MDKEYLQDYEQKELSECDRMEKRVKEGKFSFEKDRYPPDERFVGIQEPVVLSAPGAIGMSDLCAQIPFSGSLIVMLPPYPKALFEQYFFETSEIPKLIDFIKETGKLQVGFILDIRAYEGLDYLDPFFIELEPPLLRAAPVSIFGREKEIKKIQWAFTTLGSVRYADFLRRMSQQSRWIPFYNAVRMELSTYTMLKLGCYTHIVEEIENLMIDDPAKANSLIATCRNFIVNPLVDLRTNLRNFTLSTIRETRDLPLVYRPQEIRFPCEIGKFLLEKLTYAPLGLDASKELIYHYDAYDLQKVLKSLNEAIVTNHPDILKESAGEFSEILDNVWEDPTIPRRIKGLRIGVPLSIAAIGSVAAGPIGAAGGFLAGLGFDVASKLIDVEATGLSERLAKLRAKSYQANIYDFKKKYKTRNCT